MAVVLGSEGMSCLSCIEKDRKVEFLLDTLGAVVKPTKVSEHLIPELVEWLCSERGYTSKLQHHGGGRDAKYSVLAAIWCAGEGGGLEGWEEAILTSAFEAFNKREANDKT